MLRRMLDVGSSLGVSIARAGAGMQVGTLGPRPAKRLKLYEYEGCPFCRKVREALSILDLEAEIYPCPRNAPRFRAEVVERGGRAMFPYLVDPNTGRELYESDVITAYLDTQYGART